MASTSFSWLAFGVQFLLFALGLYVYLFSRGVFRFGTEANRARAEAFRLENQVWMRYLGLALAAVMLLNLVFQFMGR